MIALRAVRDLAASLAFAARSGIGSSGGEGEWLAYKGRPAARPAPPAKAPAQHQPKEKGAPANPKPEPKPAGPAKKSH